MLAEVLALALCFADSLALWLAEMLSLIDSLALVEALSLAIL